MSKEQFFEGVVFRVKNMSPFIYPYSIYRLTKHQNGYLYLIYESDNDVKYEVVVCNNDGVLLCNDKFMFYCFFKDIEILKDTSGINYELSFWIELQCLADANLITEGVHYRLENGLLDIRFQDVYPIYSDYLKRSPNSILQKTVLEHLLMMNTDRFVKRYKPFFGESKKWCMQFKYPELDIYLSSQPEATTI